MSHTMKHGRRPRDLQRPIDLSRFQPLEAAARTRVEELVRRGAVVVQVTPQRVLLRRAAQFAVVDTAGRVSWSAAADARKAGAAGPLITRRTSWPSTH